MPDHRRRCQNLAQEGEDAVPQLVDALLAWAQACAASDLHLDPCAAGIRVRLRIDGLSQEGGLLDGRLAANLVARWKVLGGLLSYRRDLPQEGAVARERSPIDRELRISCFPTVHGERVAVRIFADETAVRGLSQLGLPTACATAMTTACRARDGLVVVAGPCGAGKTTTLYACLDHIVDGDDGRVLLTIEDPVELRLAGISQSQVQPAVGFDFARALRSLLRQDPDVIMVGEIRDPETAAVAVEAAGTGHLVLTCLHAPRAAAIPQRLLDLGVAPYALAACWRLGLAQRLVRRCCPACGGAGCQACHGSGYAGRVLIAEALPAGPAVTAALRGGDATGLAAVVRSVGGDLTQAAADLIARGISDRREISRVLQDEEAPCA